MYHDTDTKVQIIGIRTVFVAQIQRNATDMYLFRAVVHGNEGQCIELVEEGDSLHVAQTKALASAEREFRERFQGQAPVHTAPPVACLLTRGNGNSENRLGKLNGGGNKPASTGQQNLIQKIAEERGIAATPLCHEMFGKGLADITGAEANEVIRRMKAST